MVPNDKMEQEGEEEDVVSNKQKYRELKKRLKYLVYENECFEHDVRQAQTKLLQLCREKSFLLDQLMRHETVVLSEDSDNETTDYSTEDDDQMDFVTKSTVARLSKPSSSSSPLTKQSTSKSTAKTTPNTKKTGQKGVVKQLSAGRGTKAIAKTLNSVKAAAAAKPPLIVSLPISSIRHSSTPPNASSTGSTPRPIGAGGKGGFSGAPAVFKKIKSVSSSSSDSSSSSSDSDSDDSSSHSSSSSDKEAESMDTAPLPTHLLPPPPLPRMVDMSPSLISQTGSKVIQPKPIPSPVTIVSPNQFTSLALVSPSGVPLLSPVPSSPLSENQKGPQTTYTLTTTSQGSFQLVPLNTTLSTASSKMLGSLTKSSGPGMSSAFHVVTTPTTQQPRPPSDGNGALQ